MFRYVTTISVIIVSVILFALSCSEEKFNSPEAVVKANLKYMNEENLSGVMSTIHTQSNAYDATEKVIAELFDQYDLEYTIEKMEVVEEKEVSAVVSFTQVTKKKSGGDFRDNRISGQHIIKKDGNNWKIFITEIYSTEYLN